MKSSFITKGMFLALAKVNLIFAFIAFGVLYGVLGGTAYLIVSLVSLCIFAIIFCIRAKHIEHDNKKIEVFSGFRTFYIKVNGEIADFKYTPRRGEHDYYYRKLGVYLFAKINDQDYLMAHISVFRFIHLKMLNKTEYEKELEKRHA